MIFPTPTYVGQPAVYQGRAWFWNGRGWQVQTNLGQVVSTFVVVDEYVQFAIEALPAPVDDAFSQITYV